MGEYNLKNKTALVCGGSDGLGSGAAEQLAHSHAKVILVGRSPEKLEAKKKAIDAINMLDNQTLELDFNDLSKVEKTISTLVETTAIHILINNCGGPPPGKLSTATIDQLQTAFGLHILASHIISKLVIPSMLKEDYGRIINIISTSVRQPIMGLGVSNTIRGAMASWSKTLSLELADTGITVNNVLPGATKTDRLYNIIRAQQEKLNVSEEEATNMMLSQVPMGRFAEVEEVSKAIAFLASPDASYITGVNLQVDGGKIKSI